MGMHIDTAAVQWQATLNNWYSKTTPLNGQMFKQTIPESR